MEGVLASKEKEDFFLLSFFLLIAAGYFRRNISNKYVCGLAS